MDILYTYNNLLKYGKDDGLVQTVHRLMAFYHDRMLNNAAIWEKSHPTTNEAERKKEEAQETNVFFDRSILFFAATSPHFDCAESAKTHLKTAEERLSQGKKTGLAAREIAELLEKIEAGKMPLNYPDQPCADILFEVLSSNPDIRTSSQFIQSMIDAAAKNFTIGDGSWRDKYRTSTEKKTPSEGKSLRDISIEMVAKAANCTNPHYREMARTVLKKFPDIVVTLKDFSSCKTGYESITPTTNQTPQNNAEILAFLNKGPKLRQPKKLPFPPSGIRPHESLISSVYSTEPPKVAAESSKPDEGSSMKLAI